MTPSPVRVAAPTPLIRKELWCRRPTLPPPRPLELAIEVGRPVAVDDGLLIVRLPLPFALDHINVYLLDEGTSWTLVDCGLDTPAARSTWEKVLASPEMGGRPLGRIVVTHHHPDHVGLAGWLAQRFDAPVVMTVGELAVSGRYADPSRDVVAERMPFWHEHGLPHALALEMLERMPRYAVQVHPLPARVATLDTTRPIELGRRWWHPIIGRGHSPEHLSLFDKTGKLVLGGDQILPKITPNIAVWPGGDANPLRSYLESLAVFDDMAHDTLLLPSHKQPLFGIASRADEIRAHHEERLQAVVATCTTPMTCFEMLPVLFGRELRNEEIGFGLGEAVAHLNFLSGESVLTSSLDPSGRRRFSRHPSAVTY